MYRPIWTVFKDALVLANLFGQFYFVFWDQGEVAMIEFSRLTAADQIEARILFKREREKLIYTVINSVDYLGMNVKMGWLIDASIIEALGLDGGRSNSINRTNMRYRGRSSKWRIQLRVDSWNDGVLGWTHIFTKGLPETGAHRMVINSVDSKWYNTNFLWGNGSS